MFGYFKILVFSVFLLCSFVSKSLCTPVLLQQVPGFSSNAVYDLFIDSKGFLWIGHNGGVSKYDGISFTNYTQPQQTSLAVSGFVEDKFGRIWFHNFTGQIFYIEKGKMKLLTAYDNKGETGFPNIGLFKNMLVATTGKGLFICDINSLKCHYETCKNLPVNGTTSLGIFKNEVIVFGNRHWFYFKPGERLKPAHFNKADSLTINEDVGELTSRTFRDTAFIHCNPGRVVYKITAANDSLKVCKVIHFKYFINSITVQSNSYWINTSRLSFEARSGNFVEDQDLNCEAIDKQGHCWYGSAQKGLFSDIASTSITENEIMLPLQKGDVLNCLAKSGNKLLIGTGYGKLISYDPLSKKSTVLTQLLSKHNGVRYIRMLDSDNVILGSLSHTFIFSLNAKAVRRTYRYLVMRQVDTINNTMLFATGAGLIALPIKNNNATFNLWKKGFNEQFKGFKEGFEVDGPYKYLNYVQRTLAVCCMSKDKAIWAALKNGLYKINSAGATPFYTNNLPVFASCLAIDHNSLIAGTINNGVLIINGNNVRHLSTKDGLLSDNIVQLKTADDNLFIYDGGFVQIFDQLTFKFVDKYQLPGINEGLITDAEQVNGQLFLVVSNRLVKVPEQKRQQYDAQICTIDLTIKGKDTDVVPNNFKLQYFQNDVGIKLGIPSLLNGKDIIVKYRLSKNGYSKWVFSRPGDRNFRFEALSPGSYQFEAMAGRLQSGKFGQPVIVNFTIAPPWWRTWWAVSVMLISSLLIVVTILRLYYSNILAKEKASFETKFAIEKERQRISNDMHDDLGASLYAIKLLTGNIKKSDSSAKGIPEIYEMVSVLSERTREVIWTLNNVYDTLDSLVHFIDLTARKLFEHSEIHLKVIISDHIPEIDINNEYRRELFLLIKEALHNILKHSQATEAQLEFNIIEKYLIIEIKDNGSGFSIHEKGKHIGLGIENMKNRIQKFGGSFLIEAKNGTMITLKMPI